MAIGQSCPSGEDEDVEMTDAYPLDPTQNVSKHSLRATKAPLRPNSLPQSRHNKQHVPEPTLIS